MQPDRAQQLVSFMSVDLANSTLFKTRQQARRVGPNRWEAPTWPKRLSETFSGFVGAFQRRVQELRTSVNALSVGLPRLWKINGDELLFHEIVYPASTGLTSFTCTVTAFVDTLLAQDKILLPSGLGLKGCIWTAGFPIRNKVVLLPRPHDVAPVVLDDERMHADFDAGVLQLNGAGDTDFIGPDMDLGFRLAAITPAGRITCSLDVAWLLTLSARCEPPKLYQVGWRSLKGIADDHPYPIFWLDSARQPSPRLLWEPYESTPETATFLSMQESNAMPWPKVREFAHSLWEQLPQYFIQPYVSPDALPTSHRMVWEVANPDDLEDIVLDRAAEAEIAGAGAFVQIDTLNQISLLCRRRPELRDSLRAVLEALSDLPAYTEWLSANQFSGKPFQIPRSFAPPDPEQRRLLEQLGFVTDNVLWVMVNRDAPTGRLFLTDGLFVPAEIRVFPFADESDRIREQYTALGWHDWADTVIDVAVGCGHNLLKYGGAPDTRIGFDVSLRALAYAALNAQLNDTTSSGSQGSRRSLFFGLNDVRNGLPGLSTGKRVLFLVNMPFALEPLPETLVRTAAGGENGYELTVAALEAIRAFIDSHRGSDHVVRAVVLAYSVGSLHRDYWIVPHRARDLFHDMSVSWRILDGECLWRINGRKEQPNPMPLTSLSRKADCKYYVRNPNRREEIRAAYVRKEHALRDEGYDHLSYGALHVSSEFEETGGLAGG
jgi:hypothetical protein